MTSRGFQQVARTKDDKEFDPLSMFIKEVATDKDPDSAKLKNLINIGQNALAGDKGDRAMDGTLLTDYFDEPFPQSKNQPQKPKLVNTTKQSVASQYASRKNSTSSSYGSPSEVEPTPSSTAPEEEVLCLLSGEQKVMSIKESHIQLSPGSFIPGTLLMTNFRIAFIPSMSDLKTLSCSHPSIQSWLQIPLACIDRIEKEKRTKEFSSYSANIVISCKDFRVLRLNISNKSWASGDHDVDRVLGVMSTYVFPNNMRYLFSFSHTLDLGINDALVKPYDYYLEFSRLGLLDNSYWRITNLNCDYKLCSTYPQYLFVPSAITDDELFQIAAFRSGRRLPVLCWGDPETGATMWRSSQPKAGVSGSCAQDEKMLDLIARSSIYNKRKLESVHLSHEPILQIVDCRSRASAMANRAAGAGYENQNNYPSCRLDFFGIPNIHAVRESHKGLASIILAHSVNYTSDVNFSKQVEDTQWLVNLRMIMKAAWDTAMCIHRGIPVLVHCSHGWDRTAQVCSLAQLLLDPYYRTMEGFKVLVEKEWVSFGHPFQLRCSHSQDKNNRNEDQMSPIMLQFLDCVWQIVKQHPQFFEFNIRYILTISDHIYSARFGTFLFNSDCDRDLFNSRSACADIWTYLHYNREVFTNPLYFSPVNEAQNDLLQFLSSYETSHHLDSSPTAATELSTELLPPLSQLLRNVSLWNDYFLRWSSSPSIPVIPHQLAHFIYSDEIYLPLRSQEVSPPLTRAKSLGVSSIRCRSNTNSTSFYNNDGNIGSNENLRNTKKSNKLENMLKKKSSSLKEKGLQSLLKISNRIQQELIHTFSNKEGFNTNRNGNDTGKNDNQGDSVVYEEITNNSNFPQSRESISDLIDDIASVKSDQDSRTMDLEVYPYVTSNDFWEAAYLMERNRRCEAEKNLENLELHQEVILTKVLELMNTFKDHQNPEKESNNSSNEKNPKNEENGLNDIISLVSLARELLPNCNKNNQIEENSNKISVEASKHIHADSICSISDAVNSLKGLRGSIGGNSGSKTDSPNPSTSSNKSENKGEMKKSEGKDKGNKEPEGFFDVLNNFNSLAPVSSKKKESRNNSNDHEIVSV